jgi:hypothetical protein
VVRSYGRRTTAKLISDDCVEYTPSCDIPNGSTIARSPRLHTIDSIGFWPISGGNHQKWQTL